MASMPASVKCVNHDQLVSTVSRILQVPFTLIELAYVILNTYNDTCTASIPREARSRLRYKLADGERGADHVGVLDGSGQRRLAQGLCQAGDAAVMRHNLYSHQRTPPPPCPTKDHR